MKLLPLIGALLLSAVPVQSIETEEELDKACLYAEENTRLCMGVYEFAASLYKIGTLCELEKRGMLTAEQVTEVQGDWTEKIEILTGGRLWKEGIKSVLESVPECSIKPIP
ncbi:hypothetical protein [Synechococcus sp. CC9616]|uniref:hypothetical protein n=1 Tax=Synechococcus sp. CC9616 TaxID=110663 RepID=UPI00048F7CAB|nr:hypothetical protein [Synechococcus sp. CC9616]